MVTMSLESATLELPYHRLRTASLLYGKSLAALTPEEDVRVSIQAEKEYLIEQAILEAPEAVGVLVSEAELTRALTEIRHNYPDAAAFEASLEACSLDAAGLRLALARQCRVNTILDKVDAATPVVIDDVEIASSYHAHLQKFQQPERRDAYHILISINEDFPENSRPQAAARIQRLAAHLADRPVRFETLAGRHSECPTAMRGGRIGLVRRGQLFPALDAALFRLRPGQLSDVVESAMGFHLLRCQRIEAPHTLSLSQATATIRKILAERLRELRRRQWIAGLLPNLHGGTPT